MVPYFKHGTISASIYQRPHMQGQAAVRLAVDHIVNGVPIPPSYYLNPQIVLQSNLSLFREISSAKVAERAEPANESPISTLLAYVNDN
jgi:ABC-type sugar transport system substrate-binding protein